METPYLQGTQRVNTFELRDLAQHFQLIVILPPCKLHTACVLSPVLKDFKYCHSQN
jgi:hypothetical protein